MSVSEAKEIPAEVAYQTSSIRVVRVAKKEGSPDSFRLEVCDGIDLMGQPRWKVAQDYAWSTLVNHLGIAGLRIQFFENKEP